MFKNSALFKLYENLDFSNGLSIFFVGISLLVNLCVVIIFLAIFIDFIETGSKKKIKLERKNLVATFSMTLFFILMYLFIRFNIGHFALQNFISNFLLLIFGTLLIIIGTIFNILGRIQLGKNWSNQIRVYEDHTLVASGVYAIIRHPLYASLIWMFFGAGLIYRNYLVLICNTLFFIPAMYYRAKKEEQILAKHFFEYINYSHNVPMFFPKIEKILNLKNVSYIDKNGIKFSRGVSVLLLAIAIVFKIKILVIIVLLLKLISVTDIAILIIAADDGIQPQTEESIKIIHSAKLPLVVAINKIDKPEADQNKIKQQLAQKNLIPEDWGGKTICVPISAKQGLGIDELLDTLVLIADLNKDDITANPAGKAYGTVIESHIDKGEGPVATVLIQNGTFRLGDNIFLNNFYYGKIKSLKDFKNKHLTEALPSTPVKIQGLKGVPTMGDIIEIDKIVKREQKLKHYQLKNQAAAAYTPTAIKKEGDGNKAAINFILKADVLGSLEAIIASIDKYSHPDVSINIVKKGLGSITESEILLAEANDAFILGFHVDVTPAAQSLSQEKNIEFKTYKIIYELLDEVKKRFEALIKPEIITTPLGRLKVLAVFRKDKDSQIVGGKVTKGKITPDAKVDVIRDDQKISSGKITELQANKVNVNDASLGQECGIKFIGRPIIQEGDFLEFYTEEIKKKELKF